MIVNEQNSGLTVGRIEFSNIAPLISVSTSHEGTRSVVITTNTDSKDLQKFQIKDMVSNDKQVYFIYYKDLNLWYKTEDGFEFPVSVEDTGTATFLSQDRAMMFMRYIRKHLAVIEDARKATKQ